MLVEIDKEDLISLCKGKTPSYVNMGLEIVKRNGNFKASYGRWDWDWQAFLKEEEKDLWELYLILKNRNH